MGEKRRSKKRIRFLEGMFGNDSGQEVNIWMETEKELYYYDGFRRWCYVNKCDEHVDFEYVERAHRQSRF